MVGKVLLNEWHRLAGKRAGPDLLPRVHPSCRQVDIMIEDAFLLALEAKEGSPP
jgi:hypothetical protein